MTGYDLLQAQISGPLGSKDFLEEIWTRDVVDLGDLSPAADHKRPYARRRPQGCAQGLLARLVPLNRYEQRALVRRQPKALRLSLGPRILRADTAGVAALALVQAALGDWGGPGSPVPA